MSAQTAPPKSIVIEDLLDEVNEVLAKSTDPEDTAHLTSIRDHFADVQAQHPNAPLTAWTDPSPLLRQAAECSRPTTNREGTA